MTATRLFSGNLSSPAAGELEPVGDLAPYPNDRFEDHVVHARARAASVRAPSSPLSASPWKRRACASAARLA